MSTRPCVTGSPCGCFWYVDLPGHVRSGYSSWRYAMTIALSYWDQDAAWRWYHCARS